MPCNKPTLRVLRWHLVSFTLSSSCTTVDGLQSTIFASTIFNSRFSSCRCNVNPWTHHPMVRTSSCVSPYAASGRMHALPNITSLAATPRRSLSSNNCKARSQLWSSVSTINAAYLQFLQKTKTNGTTKILTFENSPFRCFFSKFADTCWFGVTLPSTISSPKVWEGSSPHFSRRRQSLIRGSRKGIFIIPIRQIVWKTASKYSLFVSQNQKPSLEKIIGFLQLAEPSKGYHLGLTANNKMEDIYRSESDSKLCKIIVRSYSIEIFNQWCPNSAPRDGIAIRILRATTPALAEFQPEFFFPSKKFFAQLLGLANEFITSTFKIPTLSAIDQPHSHDISCRSTNSRVLLGIETVSALCHRPMQDVSDQPYYFGFNSSHNFSSRLVEIHWYQKIFQNLGVISISPCLFPSSSYQLASKCWSIRTPRTSSKCPNSFHGSLRVPLNAKPPLPGRAFPLNRVIFFAKKTHLFSGLPGDKHVWPHPASLENKLDISWGLWWPMLPSCFQSTSRTMPSSITCSKWLQGNSTNEHPQPLIPTSPMLPEIARTPGKQKTTVHPDLPKDQQIDSKTLLPCARSSQLPETLQSTCV